MIRDRHWKAMERLAREQFSDCDNVRISMNLDDTITLWAQRGRKRKVFGIRLVPQRGVSSMGKEFADWVKRCRRMLEPNPGRIRRRRQLR